MKLVYIVNIAIGNECVFMFANENLHSKQRCAGVDKQLQLEIVVAFDL